MGRPATKSAKNENLKKIKKNLLKPRVFLKENNWSGRANFSFNYRSYGSMATWAEFIRKTINESPEYIHDLEPPLKNPPTPVEEVELRSLLPEGENLFHELILPDMCVKPYLDVEFYELPEFKEDTGYYDAENVLEAVLIAVNNFFWEKYQTNIQPSEIAIATCHRPDQSHGYKYSYHIVINTTPPLVFPNAQSAVFFAQYVSKTFVVHDLEDIIDLAPYKSIQNFRLPFQTKQGETAPFIIMQQEGFTTTMADLIVTNIGRDAQILHVPEFALRRNGEKNMDKVDDTVKGVMEHYAAQLHPSSGIDETNSHPTFVQFNYGDRGEPCFLSGEIHEKIGFYCWMKDEMIRYACHSAKCRYKACEETGSGRNPKVWTKSFPMKHEMTTLLEYRGCKLGEMYQDVTNEAKMRGFLLQNSLGLSKLFADFYLNPIRRVLHDPMLTRFPMYFWTGMLWRRDMEDSLNTMIAENVSFAIKTHIQNISDEEEAYLKHCETIRTALENGSKVQQIMSFIKCRIVFDDFSQIKDMTPELLSCKNGMVNLRDGSLRPALPTDYVTKALKLEYDPTVRCAAWETFIDDITSVVSHGVIRKSESRLEYMRWMIGYAIQGNPIQKKFFVLYGSRGYEGKSLLMNTILTVIEEYGVTMDSAAIMEAPKRSAGAATAELTHLKRKRIGVLTDTAKDAKFASGLIKPLTSDGDSISVRGLYEEQSVMKPELVCFINTNFLLSIDLNDDAMYNRLVLFQFRIRFVDNPTQPNERPINHDLKNEFRDNYQGILTWIVECAVFYNANRTLEEPVFITDAKQLYKNKMDYFMEFKKTCLMVSEDSVIEMRDMMANYRQFVKERDAKTRWNPAEAQTTIMRVFGLETGDDDGEIIGYKFSHRVSK